jgi:hypothetical protein
MKEAPTVPRFCVNWHKVEGSVVVCVTSNEHVCRYVTNQLRDLQAPFSVYDQYTNTVVEETGVPL